jgi:uncharacterized protein
MQKNILGTFKYYTTLPAETGNRHKTVIIYHGWGGTAEGYEDVAEELSKRKDIRSSSLRSSSMIQGSR